MCVLSLKSSKHEDDATLHAKKSRRSKIVNAKMTSAAAAVYRSTSSSAWINGKSGRESSLLTVGQRRIDGHDVRLRTLSMIVKV